MEKVTKLLISYHSDNGRWKGVFYRHCEPYEKKGELKVKFRDIFGTAEQLLDEEESASYDIVLLIISKDYLSLGMVENGNLEKSILNFERNGTKVVLVHAEDCEWQKYDWIKKRGLRPGNSNALADDWGYPEMLDRLVSELIRGVMAEKRDTDGNNPSNEPSARKSDESKGEKSKKGRAYGEGKYGEGTYGGSYNEKELQEDFASFLIKEKGWPEVYYDNDNYKDMAIDLSIKHPSSNQLVALFNFKEKPDRKIESKAKASFAQFAELELGRFLVTRSSEKSSYPFAIYQYSDRGLVKMSPSDFPAYEAEFGEESVDDIGQIIDDVNIKSQQLVLAFRKFLKEEKNVPDSALKPRLGTFKITRNINLSPVTIEGEDGSKLAMIDFSPAMEGRGISNSNNRMRKHLVDSKLENCAAYIVCQAKYQKEYPFDIFQVTETDKPEPISYKDFPTYIPLLDTLIVYDLQCPLAKPSLLGASLYYRLADLSLL